MNPFILNLSPEEAVSFTRGIKLFNQLPENLRDEPKINRFKKGVKIWVKEKIAVKP